MKKKEQFLLLQNMLSLILTAVVLIGTAMPIAFQFLVSRDVSTGASFFNAIFIPLVLCVLVLLLYLHNLALISVWNQFSIKHYTLNYKQIESNYFFFYTLIILAHLFFLYYYFELSLTECVYFIICIFVYCGLIKKT